MGCPPWSGGPTQRSINPLGARMNDIALKLAMIGGFGILAQWLAWRFKLPAIVLLLIAGALLGPVFGIIDPAQDLGDAYKPAVGLAVAIILFEGGLTLNFSEIKETSNVVRRIIVIGGPLVWGMATLAGHYGGGLSWETSVVMGAILVITGPTVIMPLLRQAQLARRPASLLRWEAIVNDPIGALFAVLSFEAILIIYGEHQLGGTIGNAVLALALAIGGGYGLGKLIEQSFARGWVPEFLKAPILFATIIAAAAATNAVFHEAGLLTVTIMGITLANSRIASLTEMRRFKETVTVLLVSGLFILLTAALDRALLATLDWRILVFVILVLFVVRPLAIFLATIGSSATWQERVLTGWIAPRGIVAVAVAGLFGAQMADAGVPDGEKMIVYTFAIVVGTILLHGFTLGPLAKMLNLKSAAAPGILIVGGSKWSTALAKKLGELDLPATVADRNWAAVKAARQEGVDTFFGDPLSEHAHHELELNRYAAILAATQNDAYNTLVCTDFGPEIGRNNVYQIGSRLGLGEKHSFSFTIGGRQLFETGAEYFELASRMRQNWEFRSTQLSEEFTWEEFRDRQHEDAQTILWLKPDGEFVVNSVDNEDEPEAGDIVVQFAPARELRAKAASASASAEAAGTIGEKIPG